jgi:tripartite-type tricarboxylate transporter receptor subunit TctC
MMIENRTFQIRQGRAEFNCQRSAIAEFTMVTERILLAVIASAALFLSTFASATAQQYPTRTVTLVVPLPPGQTADPVCRLIAEQLQTLLGQPFIVESRPGAGGNIGAESVARSAPDGHTLLCAPEFSFLSYLLYPKLSFDPLKFEAVGVLAAFPRVIDGRATLPVANLAELITYARSNPNKLNYASQGQGSMAHLTFEALKMRAAIDLVHVPYRGGGPALNDLLAGHVDLYAGPFVGSFPHIQAGKLQLLAVTSRNRVAAFPDVPTLTEVFPGLEVDTWMSIAAPPNTPPSITKKLSDAVIAAIQNPTVRARLAELQADPVGSTPLEMRNRIGENLERWKPVITAAKITLD